MYRKRKLSGKVGGQYLFSSSPPYNQGIHPYLQGKHWINGFILHPGSSSIVGKTARRISPNVQKQSYHLEQDARVGFHSLRGINQRTACPWIAFSFFARSSFRPTFQLFRYQLSLAFHYALLVQRVWIQRGKLLKSWGIERLSFIHTYESLIHT